MEKKKDSDKERILEKFHAVQEEILHIGWGGILIRYHPDMNEAHPESMKVFQLYKEIYENMKKRLVIEYNDAFKEDK